MGPRPALPLAPPRHPTKADAPSPTRLPLAPSLSVTSYIITRANQNGSDARCQGQSPGPGWMLAPKARGPRTRRRGARLQGGGRARAPPRLVPPRRRRCSCRSPSGSRERHKLRQLLQTHFMVSLQPGAGCSRGGAAAGAERSPSGEEKVPRGPPLARTAPGPAAPPAPLRATPAPPRSPPARANVSVGNL